MGEGRDTFPPLRRLLALTESITHRPCYQDSGSNLSGELVTHQQPSAKARGLGGGKNECCPALVPAADTRNTSLENHGKGQT